MSDARFLVDHAGVRHPVRGALKMKVDLAEEQGVWDADDWASSFDLLHQRLVEAERLVLRCEEIRRTGISEIVDEQLGRVGIAR